MRIRVLAAYLVLGVAAVGWSKQGRALPLGVHTLRANDIELQQVRGIQAQYVVQVFAWNEIEPTQGEYHWEYTDWLVRAAEYYGLKVIARVDEPPPWAMLASAGSIAPVRLDDYGNLLGRVAERYRGRVAAYIVWNEPNLAREWGNRMPDPAAYAALLKAAAARLRAADPTARILCAGLAPTNERSAAAMDDRDYLRGLYAAGARPDFDVLAAHPYGFANAPGDPRGAHAGLNFSRIEDWHDIMLANGDTKAIWITEFGYTTDPPADLGYLRVSEEHQAAWLTQAYAMAREQMPFVDLFVMWNLAADIPPGDEKAGYSLTRADGTYKPAYASVQAMQKQSPADTLATNVTGAFARPAPVSSVLVLARDAIVHLGDSEYPSPWVPLYHALPVSSEWEGQFYLRPEDLATLPGNSWTLTMELMQANDLDSRVLVNDQAVDPPYLPAGDFSSAWTSAQFAVRGAQLRVGLNTVRVRDGKAFPAFQQFGYTWDDVQIRNVWLRRVARP